MFEVVAYDSIRQELVRSARRWLVTGALLDLGQTVVGLDGFRTGRQHNLDDVVIQAGATG